MLAYASLCAHMFTQTDPFLGAVPSGITGAGRKEGGEMKRQRERERDWTSDITRPWGRPPFGGLMRGGERER